MCASSNATCKAENCEAEKEEEESLLCEAEKAVSNTIPFDNGHVADQQYTRSQRELLKYECLLYSPEPASHTEDIKMQFEKKGRSVKHEHRLYSRFNWIYNSNNVASVTYNSHPSTAS